MIFTNKHDLPEEVFKALSKDRYDKGDEHSDYSVTTLITPPRIVQLQRRYKEEITEDVIDSLWSMFGHMAHALLEEHGVDEAITEKRLYLKDSNRVVSGQVDHYKNKIITDYKVTSAWTLVYGSRIKEWEEQLNLYAYLCIRNSLPVERIRIVCILRDWDKHKAFQNQDYPQTPIKIIPITLWSIEEQDEFFQERLLEHIEAEDKKDFALPLCTAEERWDKLSTYAVMKEGRKTAVRVFDTEEDADEFLKSLDISKRSGSEFIQVRLGERVRCKDYCNVSSFCNQYQEYLKAKDE